MNDYQGQDLKQDAIPAQPTPTEIEHQIERTRERMSSNIDALGDKLHPDNLKQQAKEAIAEKAQDVVANMGDQARETGSRVFDFITANPLPVAAVTLGAIWLVSMRRGSQGEVSGDRMARFAYTGPERREPNGRPALGRRLKDRAVSVRDAVEETASQAGERAGELKDRLQERAGELGSSAKERARDAGSGLERMVRDYPLAVAAGAAVIGLALGMLLPETDPERRVMGATRDELGEKVRHVAGQVKDTVQEEFNAVAPALTEALKDAAGTVKDQLKESAGRVADETRDDVRQAARGETG